MSTLRDDAALILSDLNGAITNIDRLLGRHGDQEIVRRLRSQAKEAAGTAGTLAEQADRYDRIAKLRAAGPEVTARQIENLLYLEGIDTGGFRVDQTGGGVACIRMGPIVVANSPHASSPGPFSAVSIGPGSFNWQSGIESTFSLTDVTIIPEWGDGLPENYSVTPPLDMIGLVRQVRELVDTFQYYSLYLENEETDAWVRLSTDGFLLAPDPTNDEGYPLSPREASALAERLMAFAAKRRGQEKKA